MKKRHAYIFTCEREDGSRYNHPFIVSDSEMDFRSAAKALKEYIEKEYSCKVLAFRYFFEHKTMEELNRICRMKTFEPEELGYVAIA